MRRNIFDMHETCQPTEETRKTTLKGKTEVVPVYRISLDVLYFNDRNDRIATEISRYKDENNLQEFGVDYDNLEEYNDVVQQFIINSDIESYNKTKNNIKNFSQRVSGVVLADGRVIDGNRRLACLRELAKTNPSFRYFNGIILQNETYTEKEIKELELEIQHAEEDKVQYDTIDLLAGIYKDLIREDALLTPEEYSSKSGMELKMIKGFIQEAELMAEFLEYISAPEKFHIAKDLNARSPIFEMLSQKTKLSDEEWENFKVIAFDIIMLAEKNATQRIREIKRYIKNSEENQTLTDYYNEHKEHSFKILEKLEDMDNVTTEKILEYVRGDREINIGVSDTYDKYLEQEKIKQERKTPIKFLEGVRRRLNEIDVDDVKNLNPEEKKEFLSIYNTIRRILEKIELDGELL